MPRHARLRIADLPLHIIQRGNNRSACFHQDRDYRVYLHLLADLAGENQCNVHSYVLMTNHVHLLLTPKELDGPSRLMKALGQRYAQFVNRSYERTGGLWEGRFHSSIVDSEGYLLRCHRYIEMNPVRAAMVRRPAEYGWSSYRANAEGEPSKIVVPHPTYLALGGSEIVRRNAYSELFGTPLTPSELQEIRAAANGGFVLGRPSFIREVERAVGRPAHRRAPGRPRKIREDTSERIASVDI